jgi:hypothetical protein
VNSEPQVLHHKGLVMDFKLKDLRGKEELMARSKMLIKDLTVMLG